MNSPFPTFTHPHSKREFTAYLYRGAFSRPDGGDAIVFHPKGLPYAGAFPDPVPYPVALAAWDIARPLAYREGRDYVVHVHPLEFEVLEALPVVS